MSAFGRITTLAADRSVHRAFHWLHLNELRLRQWQIAASSIPAPPFGEAARAAWFLERFRELGLEGAHIDSEGNAIAAFGDAQHPPGTPAVLLSAHLDTVFPAATDCVPREDGAVLRGPGISDNAAGLAALLGTAAALIASGMRLPCPVLLAANVGEEGEGNLRGMRHLLAAPVLGRSVACVIALEGRGNAIVVDRALGSRRFRVRVEGPGGHSWADSAQLNPIFALSAALAAASRLALPSSARTTLHAGTIAGGTSVNSIPQWAEATLDLRCAAVHELDAAATALVATLRTTVADECTRFPRSEPLNIAVDCIGHRPAGLLAEDAPLLLGLRAVDRHLGIATESCIGSTDANWPLARGIPALALGAGGSGGGVHTLAEWYDPTGRELALRRILLHLADACTLAATGKL